MADKKISQLTAATIPLVGTEPVPLVQSGNTVKATAQDIANIALPSQSGNNGKYLTTNGTTASWGDVSGIPKMLNFSFEYNTSAGFFVYEGYNNTGTTYSYSASGTVLTVQATSSPFLPFNPQRDFVIATPIVPNNFSTGIQYNCYFLNISSAGTGEISFADSNGNLLDFDTTYFTSYITKVQIVFSGY